MRTREVLPEHAWTGSRMINVLHPDPEDLILEEVAIGLSREARYGGAATIVTWTVAQHVLFCDRMAEDDGVTSAEIRALLLLHDAPEYMLRDFISPVKRHLKEYQVLEGRWWRSFARKYGLPFDLPGIVKHYDRLAWVSEKEALISPEAGVWPGMEGLTPREIPQDILSMTPVQTQREFMKRTESFLTAVAI